MDAHLVKVDKIEKNKSNAWPCKRKHTFTLLNTGKARIWRSRKISPLLRDPHLPQLKTMTAFAFFLMSKPKRVLIIGGGFGGLACAQQLANDLKFEVTIIDRQNHHLFQPLLYQVATASLSATDIARSLRGVLDKAKNVHVILDEIDHIDHENNIARSKELELEYDYLVLATGVRTSFFGKEEWRDKVIGLKSLSDAYNIRKRVLKALEDAEKCDDPVKRQKLMTIAIVGGGPTGVELAGSFAELMSRALKTNFSNIDTSKLRTVIIEAAPRLLMPYPEDQSEYTKQHLEKLGVEVKVDTMVTDVQEERLELKTGEVIDAHTLIWAAGMEATRLTQCFTSPKDRAGRLTVEKDLSLPNNSNVFAIGDIADCIDAKDKKVPGVAPAAAQMGRHVAKVIRDDIKMHGSKYSEKKYNTRLKFSYLDKGMMAIIGRNAAVMKAGALKGNGWFAWMAWLFIHLLFLIGFRNKIAVLLGWAYSYIGSKPGARVFTQSTP